MTDIVRATGGVDQAIISQQLKVMREGGLLANRREGASIYYWIDNTDCLFLLGLIRKKIAEEKGENTKG